MRPIHDDAGVPVGVFLADARLSAHFGNQAIRIERV
jgi:hypothetical protein